MEIMMMPGGRIYDIRWFTTGSTILCGTPKRLSILKNIFTNVYIKDVVERNRIQKMLMRLELWWIFLLLP